MEMSLSKCKSLEQDQLSTPKVVLQVKDPDRKSEQEENILQATTLSFSTVPQTRSYVMYAMRWDQATLLQIAWGAISSNITSAAHAQ